MPASGNVEVIHLQRGAGHPQETLLAWGVDLFADGQTRRAVPDDHLDDRRKKQNVFSYLAPERVTALVIWEDFNTYVEY